MEILKTFQIVKILILGNILRKLQSSKKNSKNKKILKIRILVNTAPEIETASIWAHTKATNKKAREYKKKSNHCYNTYTNEITEIFWSEKKI